MKVRCRWWAGEVQDRCRWRWRCSRSRSRCRRRCRYRGCRFMFKQVQWWCCWVMQRCRVHVHQRCRGAGAGDADIVEVLRCRGNEMQEVWRWRC